MKTLKLNILNLIILSFLTLSLKCTPDCKEISEGYCSIEELDDNSLVKLLEEYESRIEIPKINLELDSVDIYIDMSDGMQYAMQNVQSKSFFQDFINAQKNSKTNYYEFHSGIINPVKIDDPVKVYNYFSKTTNFNQLWAPLDDVVDSIVYRHDKSKISMCITDGELFRQGESEPTGSAFLQEALEDWLSNENLIDVYVTDHEDKDANPPVLKHLYYFIFVPKGQELNKDYQDIKDNLQSKTAKHYQFSNKILAFETGYPDDKADAVVDALTLNPLNTLRINSVEYYNLGAPWSFSCPYIEEAFDENNNLVDGGNYVFRNMYISNLQNKFFKLEDIDIRIEKINTPLTHLYCEQQCLMIEPIMEEDAFTGRNQLSNENSPMTFWCYDTTGVLKEGKLFDIDTDVETEEVKDFFVLKKELWENGFYSENKRGELGLKLDLNHLDCNKIEDSDCVQIWKVSFLINEVQSESKAKVDSLLSDFAWESISDNGTNNSLLKSFSQAIRSNNVNPANSNPIINSFYIKSYY